MRRRRERKGLLLSFLQGELQAVLRLPSQPSPAVRFFELGMDSLMAVELRNRLNRAFAGEYTAPNTIVFDYPDTESLAVHLAGELGRADGTTALPEPRIPQRRAREREEDGGHSNCGHGLSVPRRGRPGGLLAPARRRRKRCV